jgi:A/G-specific adenine glycosylase
MCQQTQVDRVVPYYERFLAQFPDERALAAAGDEAIHRAWKGLGYPSRVERLRAACQAVLAAGRWPDTVEGLRELPGVGPYTAAAVACFAFRRPAAVVDTNVARVLSRRFALAQPPDRAALAALAGRLVDRDEPIAWNNAVMELGARICTARVPVCTACPWRDGCPAAEDTDRHLDTSNPLRVASARTVYGDPPPAPGTKRLRVVIAAIHHDGRYLVARRPPGKPMAGFWEFPGGKREPGEDDRRAIAREVLEELGAEVLSARQVLTYHHAYPDQTITFVVFRIRLFDPSLVQPLASTAIRWLAPAEIDPADFPPGSAPLIARLRALHRIR